MDVQGNRISNAAKSEAVFDVSIGTAKAVPVQSRCCSRFQIQMRLPWMEEASCTTRRWLYGILAAS